MKIRQLIIRMLLFMALAHVGAAMAGDKAMGFSFNGYNMSNAETNFGVRDDKFSLVMRGKTGGGNMRGFGIFEGKVDANNQAKLNGLRNSVCSLKRVPQIKPGNNAFLSSSVTCDDGREVAATLDLAGLGAEAGQFITPSEEIVKSFFDNGEKVAKLDASFDVKPKNGKLLVTLKFANSGRVEIAFKSPATWEGHYNPIAANSYVAVSGDQASYESSQNPNETLFIPWFGGDAMINRADYPDDVVRVGPGQARYAKFLVYPDDRFKSGRYTVGGNLAIRDVLAPSGLKGRVEFSAERSIVEIPADYPANQKELGEFEVYRRAQLFDQIHGLGDTVAESGYYRAFGEQGERDDFPQRLLKGDKYPARQVENQIPNGRTTLGPATIWRWEAYPDAQMTVHSEEHCPRSGLWVATVPSYGLSEYMTHLLRTTQYAHSVEADERMPTLGLGDREREAQVVWTWIGPTNV